ncbi:MAG: aldehyde dehydrogenase family protein, partial [Pseudomonadales bacterium]
ALGIDYPLVDAGLVCASATEAMQTWRRTDPDFRAALCIEMLRRIESRCFENTHATMHTAGQSFMMGFVGSGANALDRGLEALAYAYKAMTDIPQTANWTKQFGKGEVALEKRYHFVPRGIALVICCASFPAWNAYPAIMANLMTGNPVIVKPHPNGILPMAIVVRDMRAVLAAHGIDPNLVSLAADSVEAPIAKQFLERDDVAIVDFTGSQRFGSWLEQNVRDKLVYTETSGVNSIVIESSDDPDGMIAAIANSLCLFSAQMCTSPQNIRVPSTGIVTPQGLLSVAAFGQRLVDAVNEKVSSPEAAAGVCGALQSQTSVQLLQQLTAEADQLGAVLRHSEPYVHPQFPQARTATPLIIHATDNTSPVLREEHFAPVSFVIEDDSAESCLQRAAADAAECGAIATHVYSENADFLAQAEELFVDAGASFSCNLTGPMALNYGAAYSDLHVSGLNAAGNACLTDLAFVSNRFRIVQCRWPAGTRAKQHE